MTRCVHYILMLLSLVSMPSQGSCVFSSRTLHSSSSRSSNNRQELCRNGSFYVAVGNRQVRSSVDYHATHRSIHQQVPTKATYGFEDSRTKDTPCSPQSRPINHSNVLQSSEQSAYRSCQYKSDARELLEAYAILAQEPADGYQSIPYELRARALQQSVDSCHFIIHETFTVSPQAKELFQNLNLPLESLIECRGDYYQLQLHKEVLGVLDVAADLRSNNTHDVIIQDLACSVGEYAFIGASYNRDTQIVSATRIIDLCHTLVEFGQAVSEGVFEGAYNAGYDGWQSIHDAALALTHACDHPLQTVLKAYETTKIVGTKIVNATGYSLTLIERVADCLVCVMRDVGELTTFCFDDPQQGYDVMAAGLQDIQHNIGVVAASIKDMVTAFPMVLTPGNVRLSSAFITEHGLKLATSHLCGKFYGQVANHALSYAATLAQKAGKSAALGGKACFDLASKMAQRFAQCITDGTQVADTAKKITYYITAEHEIALLAARYAEGMAAPLSVIQAINKTRLKITEKFLKHIFGLESKIVGTMEKLSGLHHDYMGELESKGIIKLINKVTCPVTGIMKANIELPNGRKKHASTTFFPSSWTRETVLKKIHEGLISAKNDKLQLQGGNWLLEGITSEGITIEYLLDNKARLISAYPILR